MAQFCKCNNGTTITRGVSPPADCSSNRTTGCEGCCDGGVLVTGGGTRGTNRGPRGKELSFRSFEGSGQTPLNVQPQWSNDGTRDQVFVGMDGSSEGYGSIFSQKNYWIGVVAGVVGLMAYQKYVK
jgi:hypothetical protein|tara:strand:+ start:2248 stop:2625 length:378 start_codon:yes stop_codon:yes gene_type:complete